VTGWRFDARERDDRTFLPSSLLLFFFFFSHARAWTLPGQGQSAVSSRDVPLLPFSLSSFFPPLKPKILLRSLDRKRLSGRQSGVGIKRALFFSLFPFLSFSFFFSLSPLERTVTWHRYRRAARRELHGIAELSREASPPFFSSFFCNSLAVGAPNDAPQRFSMTLERVGMPFPSPPPPLTFLFLFFPMIPVEASRKSNDRLAAARATFRKQNECSGIERCVSYIFPFPSPPLPFFFFFFSSLPRSVWRWRARCDELSRSRRGPTHA